VCAVALAHCNTTDRTRRAYLRANAATIGKPARPAIVIAGFGVTRLVDPVTKRHVWGTPRAVWRTQYEDDLDLDPNDRLVPAGWVGSRGPINTGWQLEIGLRKFGGYTAGVDVLPFRYSSTKKGSRSIATSGTRSRGRSTSRNSSPMRARFAADCACPAQSSPSSPATASPPRAASSPAATAHTLFIPPTSATTSSTSPGSSSPPATAPRSPIPTPCSSAADIRDWPPIQACTGQSFVP
jgi:hypothetical protein